MNPAPLAPLVLLACIACSPTPAPRTAAEVQLTLPSPCRTDDECTAYCLAHRLGSAAQCADVDYASPDLQAQAWGDL